MEEHFLKWINIIDFKCFHHFEAKDLQRVNLISGKNNVGKTAFMEACYINTTAMNIKNFVHSLIGIKYMRENLNILNNGKIIDTKMFMERSNGVNLISNINKSSFNIKEQDGIKLYNFDFNKQLINVNVNDFSYERDITENIGFIDSFGLSNWEIKSNYSAIQKKDKEAYLNDILREFDNSIESFKILDDLPQCKVNGEWLEITELGDGVRHIVSIVTALFQSENGYLFIDELENGIHYTHLDRVWEIILHVSKEVNCQVFATTHSKECIEAFNQVNTDNNGGYFEFYRDQKKDKIAYMKRDHEQLTYSLTHGGEVRGE